MAKTKKLEKVESYKIVGTKQFNSMLNAIEKWIASEKGNISMIGSFVSFDMDDEIKNDIMVAYGQRKVIKICLDEINDTIKKDKNEFINW